MRTYMVYQQWAPVLVDKKHKLYEPDLRHVGVVDAMNGTEAINKARIIYDDVFANTPGLMPYPIVEEVIDDDEEFKVQLRYA